MLEELKEDTVAHAGPPPPWNVVFLNDDFTPIDFVTEMLASYFGKSESEALSIALSVHYNGREVAGLYPKEIAEHKCAAALDLARSMGHPLLVITEKSG